MHPSTLVILFITAYYATAINIPIQGYDCSSTGIKTTTIGLTSPIACDKSKPQVSTRNLFGSLYNLKKVIDVQAKTCSVHVTAIVQGCGIGSHAYPKSEGLMSYHVSISKDLCLKIHQTRVYVFGPHVFKDLQINEMNDLFFNYANVNDGSCQDNNIFYLNDKMFEDAYAQITLRIILSTTIVSYNLYDHHYTVDNQLVCKNSDLNCMNTDGFNTYVFQSDSTICKAVFKSSFYTGYMNVTNSVKQNKTKSLLTVFTKDHEIVSTLSHYEKICGGVFNATDISGMYVVFHKNINITDPIDLEVNPNFRPEVLTSIDLKLNVFQYYTLDNLKELYYQVNSIECQTKYLTMQNLISLAYTDPMLFVYEYMRKPGYTGVIHHETLSIYECKEYDMILRGSSECYNDIPVYHKRGDWFLTPRSHVLKKNSIKVPCSMNTIIGVNINGLWYTTYPAVSLIDPPVILDPNTEQTMEFKEVHDKSYDHILPETAIQQFLDEVQYTIERKTLTSKTVDYMNSDPIKVHIDDVPKHYKSPIYGVITGIYDHIVNGYHYYLGVFLLIGTCTVGYMCFDKLVIVFSVIVMCYRSWREPVNDVSSEITSSAPPSDKTATVLSMDKTTSVTTLQPDPLSPVQTRNLKHPIK